jgi:hypothetical protein
MPKPFKFLMIGAMYENGGNTTHRFLDGHPEMFVYPFESQIGTALVKDAVSSMFPLKYRWPTFALEATPAQDYRAIIDEECKVRARTPHVSKFRHIDFDFSDDDRCNIYVEILKGMERTRHGNVEAFFRATFEAWKNYRITGQQKAYVGYSPIITVDADKILDEMPEAHFLHVIRNPWSAYADTKKRPVPLSLASYMTAWSLNQYYALLFQKKYPERFHIIRTEDTLRDPQATLAPVCKAIGLDGSETLKEATFNGEVLQEVYPWGTIRKANSETNYATALELTVEERKETRWRTWQYLDVFDYSGFIKDAG